jgi:tRNA(Arg) A34 adenosine deaminase TadA
MFGSAGRRSPVIDRPRKIRMAEQPSIEKLDPMGAAFAAAAAAGAAGEVPIGAAILRNGALVASAGNRTIRDRDPTAHAEILAIRAAAAALGSERLADCDLYVTLEPCAMCAGAISFARIRRLYYAASDEKGGAVEHGPRFFAQPTCHHAPEVYGGIRASEAADLLRGFFVARR